ncbi:hypothetical protein FHG87_008484 [Trinorchestia longiramus]|nr:hypothetical protein FHG87_008484 [Trinorchestia longiramus]
MGYRIFSGFTIESSIGFSSITCLQRNSTWIQRNIPSFIGKDVWPTRSPYLNPLDFSIWSTFETRVSATLHISLESFKAKLQREWEAIPQEQIPAACDKFVNGLGAVVRNKGG